MKKLSLVVLALAASSLSLASSAAADSPALQPVQPLQRVQAETPLACSGSGASDVRSQNHSIKNTLHTAIPKGWVLRWRSSNGMSGNVTLNADLAPGESVDVYQPGHTNGYSCTAGFFMGEADFLLKSVKWTGPNTAQVEIVNTNPFVAAGASVIRVESLKCLQSPVQTVSVTLPSLDKGASKTVDVQIPQANADYLQATANATSSVPETNKANNVQKSSDFGKNKSCNPG